MLFTVSSNRTAVMEGAPSSSDEEMPHFLSSRSSSEDSGNESEFQSPTLLTAKFWDSSDGSDSDHPAKTDHCMPLEPRYWTSCDSNLFDKSLQQELLMNPNEGSSTLPCKDSAPVEHDTVTRGVSEDNAFR